MTEARPTEVTDKSGELWKKGSLGLAGVLVGIIPWLVGVTRDLPSRTEVMNMIEKRAPYVADRARILDWIERSKQKEDNIGLKIERLHESVIRLDAGMRQLSTNLTELREALKGKQ